MKVVTANEMRNIDEKTIKEYGIPGSVLMERAGLAVAAKVRDLFEKKKVVVLSGGGNNGGDGIVAARNLFNWGWNVKVLLMIKEDRLSPDCLSQYRIARKIGVPVEFRTKIDQKDLHGSIVIDALLGTGLNKPVMPPMSDVIRFLNNSEVTVISVDIPSGISSDTGQVMGDAVMADYTVTFGLKKVGHILHPGAEYSGEVSVEDIGFPEELLCSDTLMNQTVEKQDVIRRLPDRLVFSHKGDYGHVLVVAGSRGKTGAAFMTAKSCLRSGAGLVTLGVPESLVDVFQSRVTEEMVLPLPDRGTGVLSKDSYEIILEFLDKKADVLAIGPGITFDVNMSELIKTLIKTVTSPVVMDADAINALSFSCTEGQGIKEILRRVKAPIILTPHPGEMARLLCSNPSVIEKDRINTAASFARETGTYLVLKGVPSVISDTEGRVYINTTGNPGMATAGSGDVLTGMIAAFLAQGMNPTDSSILGVYLHGLAGDITAKKIGEHSLIASDIINEIPAAFMALKT